MDEVRFQQVLDEAWLSFRCQLLQAHAGDAPGPGSATKSDFQSSLASRDSHRHRVRTLTFDIDDEILRPPPSARPSLLMQPNAQPHIATIEEEFPPPPLPFEPAPRRSSVRSSRTSQRSHVSSHNHTDSVSGERSDGGLPNRTMTANTLDSHMEHTNETLKMRLGKTRGPVTGEELHDAVVALGLTRFSVQDVNLLLNRLGDFIDLQYEPLDPSKKQPKLSHSGTLMTRSSVKQHVTAHGVEVKNCKAVWKWPEEALHNRPGFQWAGRSELPSREYNAVPFRALVLACRMEQDAKRIFGSSYDLFNAIKEILLAGDTNRLVAELTFVRINDLAAPQQIRDPAMYLEPFVAVLIITNAILLGAQTDERLQDWPGWQWLEIGFTAMFFVEMCLRLRLVGLHFYFCGPESSWNYFDVFLVAAGIVDIGLTAFVQESEAAATQLLRACRLARLTRMFRVFRLKFIKELQLMIKGLVAGLRTLCLAFGLLFVVLYVIAVFATITIGRGTELADADLKELFRSVPTTMFTIFRCYSGECIGEDGAPLAPLLAKEFGAIFVLGYVAGYMLVTMGIFNVILAVYVDITMKAARENEATTSEAHERESIRIARLTRELVKRFKQAHEKRSREIEEEAEDEDLTRQPSSPGAREDDEMQGDQMQISKELFLLVIQDRQVQHLMDDLDLPKDRANLFEALDADSSGTLHLAELAQGLLKVRGELKKTDTVATLLATKAVYATLEQLRDDVMDLRKEVAGAVGGADIAESKSIFDFR